MKRTLAGHCLVTIVFATSNALGQATCEPAGVPILPILSETSYSGTTCSGVSGVPLGAGGTRWPTVAFTFTARSAWGAFQLDADDGMEFRIFANACGAGDPYVSGYVNAGELLHIPADVEVLPDDTDFIMILTMDSTIDPLSPDEVLCGDFTITTPFLPVELQSFSVE